MAIVNTFAKCLASPYLSADPAAPARVDGLLRLAADRLEAATLLHDGGSGDQADVTLFSYEAMFACVRALVYRQGYREAGLRCLLLACEALYIRPGTLDVAHIHAFERAQGLKTPPAANLAAAAAFLRATVQILGPAAPPTA